MPSPTVQTPELVTRFIQAIEDGASMRLAAGAAGVAQQTASRWYVEDYNGFRVAVDAARARRATRWLRVIEKAAAEDWKAAQWLLEHCETEDYGKSVKTSVQEEIKSFLDGLKGRLGSQAWREVLSAASVAYPGGPRGAERSPEH